MIHSWIIVHYKIVGRLELNQIIFDKFLLNYIIHRFSLEWKKSWSGTGKKKSNRRSVSLQNRVLFHLRVKIFFGSCLTGFSTCTTLCKVLIQHPTIKKYRNMCHLMTYHGILLLLIIPSSSVGEIAHIVATTVVVLKPIMFIYDKLTHGDVHN